ncbi:MAG: aldolase [Actinomycetia bacterium]|nr:aldolase [Actinomycetes bacterium]
MSDHHRLRNLWNEDTAGYGAFLWYTDAQVSEDAAGAGFDYLVVDMQHGLPGNNELAPMLRAMAPFDVTPIVRVPVNEPGVIGRALDLGALGVIIPMVNTAEETAAAVDACRYTPQGSRSFGPTRAGSLYGRDYASTANDQVLCIPMIETREAVENADAILSVPGVDAAYIGPSDLSLTLGLPPGGDSTEQVFVDAIDEILAACARHDVVPAIHADAHLAAKRRDQGFRMITVSTDMFALRGAYYRDLKGAKE